MESEFDTTEYWKDQERVTLYHGTTIRRFDSILEHGLTLGDDQRIYFTTAPEQARQYARMDGETRYLSDPNKGMVEESETIVLKLKLPPELLNLSGGGAFKTRHTFQANYDLIQEYFNKITLEFWTDQPVDAGYIDEAF